MAAVDQSYSIVVDGSPRFGRQAVAWVRCALTLARVPPADLQVNVVPGVPDAFVAGMRCWGVRCRRLPPDDLALGPLNKLRQLRPGVLPQAPVTVLCDCDTVFTTALPDFGTACGVAGKLVDIGNPPMRYWRTLFLVLGLRVDEEGLRVTRNGRTTYRNNVNGGLYVVPDDVRDELFAAWRGFARTLLAHPDYVRPWRYHTDQIAFGLACARLGVSVNLLADRLNYPLHLLPPDGRPVTAPVVVHHHQGLRRGRLRYGAYRDPAGHEAVRERIDRVNSVLGTVAWSRFGL